MTGAARLSRIRSWLLPFLVALLILGHACELPAYAELLVSHETVEAEPAPATGHDDADQHALTCEAVLVAPGPASTDLGPVAIAQIVVASATRVTGPTPSLPARPTRSSADPPLFLLFSSFLI